MNLEVLVESALSEARRVMEKTQSFGMKVGIQDSTGFKWMKIPKDLNLNDPNARELIAYAARKAAEKLNATAVVMVNDAWVGVPTQKQKDLPPEERKKAMRARSIAELEAMGLAKRVEALVITVQTPETATMIHQIYDHTSSGDVIWGERQTHTFPQSEFRGRLTMFGPREDYFSK